MDIDVSQSNLMLVYGKCEKDMQASFNVSFCASLVYALYRYFLYVYLLILLRCENIIMHMKYNY